MERKNLSWMTIPLLLLLVGLTMTSIGDSRRIPTIYVSPETLTGHPGDSFTININIARVTELYAYGFTLDYQPYLRVLATVKVTEGPFLKQGGSTAFVQRIDHFRGKVNVGCCLMGLLPGVSGDGTLATIEFKVLEAGESYLNLVRTTFLNNALLTLDHTASNGYYVGPTANLINFELPLGRERGVGDMQVFEGKIKNEGDLPLYTRVRFDMIRAEDNKRISFYCGRRQLYVDGFEPWFDQGWTKVGSNPWLNEVGDGNYIESDTLCSEISIFTFENITLLPGEEISRVTIDAYALCEGRPGWPAHDFVDGDIYIFSPAVGIAWFYAGALESFSDWYWESLDLSRPRLPEAFYTPEGINDAQVLIHYWVDTDLVDPTWDPFRIDALRLTVDCFRQVGTGKEGVIDMTPIILGPLTVDDIGTYDCTATCEYSYYGRWWNEGRKEKPFTWSVTEQLGQ